MVCCFFGVLVFQFNTRNLQSHINCGLLDVCLVVLPKPFKIYKHTYWDKIPNDGVWCGEPTSNSNQFSCNVLLV